MPSEDGNLIIVGFLNSSPGSSSSSVLSLFSEIVKSS